jgi:hypothetical protein
MIIPPFVLYGFLLASVIGMAFFILSGSGWWQLLAYWFAAVVGFAVGQWLGMTLGINLYPFGQLNTIEGSVMSLVALIAARTIWEQVTHLLTRPKEKSVSPKR